MEIIFHGEMITSSCSNTRPNHILQTAKWPARQSSSASDKSVASTGGKSKGVFSSNQCVCGQQKNGDRDQQNPALGLRQTDHNEDNRNRRQDEVDTLEFVHARFMNQFGDQVNKILNVNFGRNVSRGTFQRKDVYKIDHEREPKNGHVRLPPQTRPKK